MADIELVIKIPSEVYENIKSATADDNDISSLLLGIYEATPLPKDHGRLIDAKEYENSIRKHYFDNRTVIRCTEIALYSAETIVEADKN